MTRDLSQKREAASDKRLREAMVDVVPPVLCGLGDHDNRQIVYARAIEKPARNAPYDYDVLIDGAHVITLDTGLNKKSTDL